MLVNPQVSLHRLVMSLSDAMDCVHPALANHQLRVAYISTNLARVMGYRGDDLLDIFLAVPSTTLVSFTRATGWPPLPGSWKVWSGMGRLVTGFFKTRPCFTMRPGWSDTTTLPGPTEGTRRRMDNHCPWAAS